MKKYGMIGFVVTFFLAIIVIAGCQESQAQTAERRDKIEEPKPAEIKAANKAEQPDAKDVPRIVMTKGMHDFDKIGPGTVHVAHYEFKNEGSKTLLVKNIQSTCGCSLPTLIKDGQKFVMPIKEPVGFEPGQSGQVEVTFTAPTNKGSTTKHMYIISDDPQTPRAQFSVKADVIVKVEAAPEQVDLKLDVDNAGMPDIVVKSTDGKEFSIESIFVAQQAINIPFDRTAKATEFTLKPTVDIDKLGQSQTGVIQIKTTHPQSGTLMVRYNIKPLYELTNPRFILQNVEPGTPIFRENVIRSNYGKAAEIESWTSRNGYMEIEKQEQDGDHINITVKITPPEQSSASRRYITDELTIAMKDGQNLTIRCSGWFRLE